MSDDNGVTPLTQTELFGHADLLDTWQKAFTNNKLHHGLLITGSQGVGKATLAFHFLKWLFKQQAAHPAIVEKQILAGSYGGLKIIERLFDEKRQRYAGEITLDAVEPVFEFLRLSSIDGGYRAIVIDGADRMNRNAQNTILKLLEEPPKKTLFILLVEQPGLLLPTIHSRCMRYHVNALSLSDFAKGLAVLAPAIPSSDHNALYALSDGALGQAVRWHEQDWTTLYSELVTAAAAMKNGQIGKPAMKWAESYASSAQDTDYELISDLMLKRYAQIITSLQQGLAMQPLVAEETALLTQWQAISSSQLLQTYDRLNQILRTGERSHLDRKLTLLQALQAFTGQATPVASQAIAR